MYLLDACGTDKDLKVTAFGKTVEELLPHYKRWYDDNSFSPEEVAYANVYDLDEPNPKHPRHAACFQTETDGTISIFAAPENSTANPYPKRRRLFVRVRR